MCSRCPGTSPILGCGPKIARQIFLYRHGAERGYWFFAWRYKGGSARVKRTTSSPVTVLMS